VRPGRVVVAEGALELRLDAVERAVNGAERRPARRFAVPAQLHQLVDGFWRVVGAVQHVALLEVLDDLLVRHPVVGLQRKRKDLPQDHAERPHVRLNLNTQFHSH